jgi:two-component system sensor histidine kinase KdpD
MRALIPYLLAALGVLAVTAAIGGIERLATVPTLAMLYLVVVLWLGARYGRLVAVAGSVMAFLAYDFFLVPPRGTFVVSGPSGLFELALLLAAALVTGQLAGQARRSRLAVASAAAENRSLYELAATALRWEDERLALHPIIDRARAMANVRRMSVLEATSTGLERLVGDPLSAQEQRQAEWSQAHLTPVGVRISEGQVLSMETADGKAAVGYLPGPAGVVVLELAGSIRTESGEPRLLAALVSLSNLLLERRRAMKEADRRQAIESSDQLKTAILSSLSHELRSPLASLRTGLTSLLVPKAGLSAEQRELVGSLDAQASRLDELVDDLLTLSRIEAGVGLELERHGLDEILEGALRAVGPRLGRRTVKVDVTPNLPDLVADELQLQRVMANLLHNAVQWSAPEATIEVTARATGGELEVSVETPGASLPEPDPELVFEKFWTRREGGTGLGLAICKRIVEAHGGRIHARNLRDGVRFWLELPLVAEPVAAT